MVLLYLNVRINCYRSYIGPSGTKEVISGKDRQYPICSRQLSPGGYTPISVNICLWIRLWIKTLFMNRKLLFSFSPIQMVSSFLPFLFQHQCHLLRVSIFPWPSNLKQVILPLCSLHKTWKTQNSFTSFPLELRELPRPEPQPSTVYSKNYAKTKF